MFFSSNKCFYFRTYGACATVHINTIFRECYWILVFALRFSVHVLVDLAFFVDHDDVLDASSQTCDAGPGQFQDLIAGQKTEKCVDLAGVAGGLDQKGVLGNVDDVAAEDVGQRGSAVTPAVMLSML